MGMSIDKAIKQLETYSIPCGKYKEAYDFAIDTMRKYQMMQADYEARLKADMVAMLSEIQLEIEELPTNRMAITDSSGLICYGYSEYEPSAEDASKLIQQKIKALEKK